MRHRTAGVLVFALLLPLLAPVYAHALGGAAHHCSDLLCTCPPDCPHHAAGHGGHSRQPRPSHDTAGHGAGGAHGQTPAMGDCESEGDCHLASPQTPGHPLTVKALPRAAGFALERDAGNEVLASLLRRLLRADNPPTEPPRG